MSMKSHPKLITEIAVWVRPVPRRSRFIERSLPRRSITQDLCVTENMGYLRGRPYFRHLTLKVTILVLNYVSVTSS